MLPADLSGAVIRPPVLPAPFEPHLHRDPFGWITSQSWNFLYLKVAGLRASFHERE
jgi:hypothetical protein